MGRNDSSLNPDVPICKLLHSYYFRSFTINWQKHCFECQHCSCCLSRVGTGFLYNIWVIHCARTCSMRPGPWRQAMDLHAACRHRYRACCLLEMVVPAEAMLQTLVPRLAQTIKSPSWHRRSGRIQLYCPLLPLLAVESVRIIHRTAKSQSQAYDHLCSRLLTYSCFCYNL